MDQALNPLTGDYTGQLTDTLANAVYLRLMTPLGRYWAAPSIGSRLHELQREKDVPRVKRLAQQYAAQALSPLVKDGRAQSVTVTADAPHDGRLLLYIEVVDATGQTKSYEHLVTVGD